MVNLKLLAQSILGSTPRPSPDNMVSPQVSSFKMKIDKGQEQYSAFNSTTEIYDLVKIEKV